MDHNREASQHLTSFLQLFFGSMRLGQGVRDIVFLLLKLHQVRLQDLSKLAAARHRQSWVVKTWQKPRWGKAGKEEKLNKTTMPHISVFNKPRETCQMGSCSHGMFFATIPYRFRYRFVIVLVPSALHVLIFVVHVNDCGQQNTWDSASWSNPMELPTFILNCRYRFWGGGYRYIVFCASSWHPRTLLT